MGIFGWDYPPGCNSIPDDEPEFCEVCYKPVNDCICPECSVCEETGRHECYAEHGLVLSPEQTKSREAYLRDQIEEMKDSGELF